MLSQTLLVALSEACAVVVVAHSNATLKLVLLLCTCTPWFQPNARPLPEVWCNVEAICARSTLLRIKAGTRSMPVDYVSIQ